MLKPKNLKFWSSLPRSKTNTPWAFSFRVFSATKNLEDDDLKPRGKKNRWRWWGCGWSLQAFDLQKKNTRRFSSNWKCCDLMVPFQDLQCFEIQLEIIIWVFPKIMAPQIGVSIIFTIHFGGLPLFLETPICIHLCKEVASIHQDEDSLITTRMTTIFFCCRNPFLWLAGWWVDPNVKWRFYKLFFEGCRKGKKSIPGDSSFFFNGWFKTKTQVCSAICVFFKVQQKKRLK